jgi:CHASE3 domain sensor protein
MRDEIIGFVIVTVLLAIYALLGEWQMQQMKRRHAQETARLRRNLSEHQRNLAAARTAEREAQQTTVRTKILYDQAVAQRDGLAIELAHLRDRYIEIAGCHRNLVISRLADGLGKYVKISRN